MAGGEQIREPVATDDLHGEPNRTVGGLHPVLRDRRVVAVRHHQSTGDPGAAAEPLVLDGAVVRAAADQMAVSEAGQAAFAPDVGGQRLR